MREDDPRAPVPVRRSTESAKVRQVVAAARSEPELASGHHRPSFSRIFFGLVLNAHRNRRSLLCRSRRLYLGEHSRDQLVVVDGAVRQVVHGLVDAHQRSTRVPAALDSFSAASRRPRTPCPVCRRPGFSQAVQGGDEGGECLAEVRLFVELGAARFRSAVWMCRTMPLPLPSPMRLSPSDTSFACAFSTLGEPVQEKVKWTPPWWAMHPGGTARG